VPHKANEVIAKEIVQQNWFQSQSKEGLPSDNWRLMEDDAGQRALLYLVRFLTATGEPRRIPNNRQALPRLYWLDRALPAPKSGPFIALAQASDASRFPTIVGLWIWDLSVLLPSPWPALKVADLGPPAVQLGRPRPFQYPMAASAVQERSTERGRAYDSGAIRKLLGEAFTARDLRRFCQSYSRLRPIVRYFGPDAAQWDMIDITIEYCQKWSLVPELLARVREFSPAH